jgi:hypothetical protein
MLDALKAALSQTGFAKAVPVLFLPLENLPVPFICIRHFI